jgi:hypothetical protein
VILDHFSLEIELPDEWWQEAGMDNFHRTGRAYRVDPIETFGKSVFEVSIAEVAPMRRAPGVGIFNTTDEKTAQERVVSILKGFVVGAAIPPIEVLLIAETEPYRYRLLAGVHRFYCSIAAGYSHVPAIEGFDFKAWNK